jgi:hypothetical protein
MTYRHKQVGYWILAIVSVPVAASVAIGLVAGMGKGTTTILFLSLLIPLAAGVVFSTMSVAVDDTAVSWHFTGGIAKGRVPLEAIVSAEIVELPWFYGWGIRFTPRGTLYRVGGKSAVEVVTDKKRINLGSDDAEGLASAIRDARDRGRA